MKKRKMKVRNKHKVEMSRFSGLSGIRDISHFMTKRHGGVSAGAFASMNPSEYSGDDAGAVRENRAILCAELGILRGSLFAPFQTHEDKVCCLDKDFFRLPEEGQRLALRGVDALVTDMPEVCVAVSTADCVPLLFYAPDRKVVAAVHAGWRGTVLRIASKAVRVMEERYGCDPAKLLAGIGPSISPAAFEVGEEVVEAFRASGFDMGRVCSYDREAGKAHIDLWEANRSQLLDAGVLAEHIEVSGICSYTQHEDYFSARRLGIKSGRILSGIYVNK